LPRSQVRLELDDNRLTGTLPSEVGLLSELESLEIATNTLSGAIPTEIGLMNSMRNFDVSHNKFNSSLPTEIGGLKILAFFRFDSNSISGSLPSEIGLTNLSKCWDWYACDTRVVYFCSHSALSCLQSGELSGQQNELTGLIPSEIGQLIRLSKFLTAVRPSALLQKQLLFSHECFNACFFCARSLATLKLDLNAELTGTVPNEICELPLLIQIGLSPCQFISCECSQCTCDEF
jgi:hypothetical protein